jgi:hypothetical protein
MRLIAPLADRLVSIVVPRLTAAASCPGTFSETCSPCARNSNHIWQKKIKKCHYSGPHCTTVCGSCTLVGCSPP